MKHPLRPKAAAIFALTFAVTIACFPALAFQNTTGLLADEPFGAPSGALNRVSSGSGWAGPWQVQNGSTAVPGYNVASANPIAYSGVAQSGGYGAGGSNWQTSGRRLNTSSGGFAAAGYVGNGLIGQRGQTLYMSFLMRQDLNTGDEMTVTLHPGGNPAWYVSSAGISAGHFGGSRFWSMKLAGTVYPTKVPVVTGQAALLVLRMDFSSLSTVSLYVNPNLRALPSTPDATATTRNSIAFQSVAYYGGSGAGQSSIDEIRFAGSYGELSLNTTSRLPAPTNVSAISGDRQVSLSWTAVTGASGYKIYQSASGTPQLQATVSTNNGTAAGLNNGTTYTFYVVATNSTGDSLPSANVTSKPRGVAPTPHPILGTNLSELKDYGRSWPFVDAFRMARPWISQMQGAPWGSGPPLQLDANGWIKSLQTGQYAETIIFDNGLDDQAHYPTGDYTLLYDGKGTIGFDLQSATVVSSRQGRMVVNVPGGHDGIFLTIMATDPTNPIRNIRFIMPGFESAYATQPFHPLFLNRLQTYKALRFMDWSLTNGSPVQNWVDRAAPTDYTYVLRGVPLEMMIQLANSTGAMPWFNIPAQATDDYVRQFATLVTQNLAPGAKFYVEYSNETWNGMFSQNSYIRSQGQSLGLSTDPTLAAAYYTAYRSVQIFKILQSVVGTSRRMVRVIASQAANSWLSDQTLGFQNAFGNADALAIAPYFNCSDSASGGFGILGDPATASQVDAMSVDRVIDIELEHINGCAQQQMQSNGAVARSYGLAMVGYEGGQSLVGYNGAENDATMTSLFKAANRSTRMSALYTQYLNNWVAAGGDLLIHFNETGPWTKYGSWGALEYQDQDLTTAPKFQALSAFATQHP
jgi:hypothetical protein